MHCINIRTLFVFNLGFIRVLFVCFILVLFVFYLCFTSVSFLFYLCFKCFICVLLAYICCIFYLFLLITRKIVNCENSVVSLVMDTFYSFLLDSILYH